MNFDQIVDGFYKMPEKSKQLMSEFVTEEHFEKGHILLKANKTEANLYFIKKGIVRAYSDWEDSQITFWFGREGETIISIKSYIKRESSYENIELLEDCELYKINIEDLYALYQKDIHIANWGRKFAEHELIKTEERLISRQFKSAKERYQELMASSPELLQRVKLSIIASYLGITQVSLSRIRADLR